MNLHVEGISMPGFTGYLFINPVIIRTFETRVV